MKRRDNTHHHAVDEVAEALSAHFSNNANTRWGRQARPGRAGSLDKNAITGRVANQQQQQTWVTGRYRISGTFYEA
jgi:hypothetical protein